MAISGGIMAGASVLSSSYSQASALKSQGSYTQMQDNANARLMDIQGKDALRRGDLEADAAVRKGKQVVGSQVASAAAQGVDVSTGSAKELQNQTKDFSEMDAMTARNNAWRQAWGFKVQANNSIFEGMMAKSAGDSAAKNTLLAGGMQAASSFMKAGSAYGANSKPGSGGYNKSFIGNDSDAAYTATPIGYKSSNYGDF